MKKLLVCGCTANKKCMPALASLMEVAALIDGNDLILFLCLFSLLSGTYLRVREHGPRPPSTFGANVDWDTRRAKQIILGRIQ